MTDFKFTPLVNSPHADVISTALGSASNDFSDTDNGQGVKLSTAQNYIQAVDGNDLEGVVVSMEGITVNDGYSFGSIQRDKRIKAQIAANEVGTVPITGLVVVGTPIALGTANGFPQVKTGAPTEFKWRVIRHITGTGVAGDEVLIERV